MDKLSQLWRRLLFYVRRDQFDRELEEEMRFHLEMKAEENLAAGISTEEARYAAQRQFGNQTLLREVSREMWAVKSIETLFQDLRYGVRTLLKNPGFTVVAVLTLALGIGANTAIFSVVNAMLLRPLPYADDERLVMIGGKFPAAGIKRASVSVPELIDYSDRTHSFAQVGVYGGKDFTLTGRGDAERFSGALVSANFLSLLGVNPALGRHFLTEENQPDRSHVAILSYGLWQRRFGGDPQLIGQEVTLDGLNYTVVGVMPPGFQFPLLEAEIWRPLDITAARLNERYSRRRLGPASGVVGQHPLDQTRAAGTVQWRASRH